MIQKDLQDKLFTLLKDRLRSKSDTVKLAMYAAAYIRDVSREHPELTGLLGVVEILRACGEQLGKDLCVSSEEPARVEY